MARTNTAYKGTLKKILTSHNLLVDSGDQLFLLQFCSQMAFLALSVGNLKSLNPFFELLEHLGAEQQTIFKQYAICFAYTPHYHKEPKWRLRIPSFYSRLKKKSE